MRVDLRVSQLLAVGIMGLAALLSWQRAYRPAVRAVTRDRQQIAALNGRLAELETMVSTAGGQAAWVTHHQQRLVALRAKFPRQAQFPQVLNALVDTLKSGDVKLVNVTQGNAEPAQGTGGPLLIDGLPCFRLPVTITAQGRYHALVDALGRLTAEDFPGLVTVTQVELRREGALTPRLNASIQLQLHVLGAPPAAPQSGGPG